eukprot:CAMPEP_0197178270 /NCGR_PEP_ID=MMETSP1423-20130617/3607_1 /TAXON_ID=476441 /ORGANISM="Pseudo-nitzschia heimii, Strain UNC1101" /LENGTH=258 /DNA_ID=CAMNT_0042627977 /DNA_START=112 /DNA_END=888 /DNA_ORIENTATION=+
MTTTFSMLHRSVATTFALLLVPFFLLLPDGVHAGTNEAGLAFLAENKGKPGVVELPSGLQYKVLRKGRGIDHPVVSASCSCHYEGKLLDGTVFDSSYERGSPSTFAPNQVIRGWTEAMQMMVVGDKWEMYIPSDLAYGDRGSPPKIGGGEVLVFQMEIMAIMGGTVPALKCSIDADPDAEEEDEDDDRCNDKERGYIAKVRSWYADGNDGKPATELARIRNILNGDMKDTQRDWARRRAQILEQFLEKQPEEEKSSEL